ncbi:MAG: tRNA1(Val) (adenine(37)-N6)-methyltransferase [Paludibacteraceae bacterium]|nr:tRNA1(Val) (adenine(37)-N6)-methyltransferase [Paludibacteraceae bacterium]
MSRSEGFRFKQFYVRHDRCAMKVGTDGVLLGAWTPIDVRLDDVRCTILDIGTGSGLVALMLAQRCPEAKIDAIDIDEAAIEQAKQNFKQSAFSQQLSVYQSSLQEWQIVPSQCTNSTLYDLIVSNPPYFQNSLKNPDAGRQLARHTDTLRYEELIAHSARLLNPNGQLALILPAEAEREVTDLAEQAGLHPARVTRVYSKVSKPAIRVLLCFQLSTIRLQPTEDTLVLEDEKGGRSAAYSELCKEFYL